MPCLVKSHLTHMAKKYTGPPTPTILHIDKYNRPATLYTNIHTHNKEDIV